MENSNEGISSTYCVTGATGYIGSWLVKSLLQRGFKVHATLRNPEKATGLLQWWQGGARLSLFRADLHENGSFDDAVRGCDGVFHVAASMEFDVSTSREDLGSHVKTDVIDPAIRGTLNVLKACLKSNIRKVVFTSSISTLTAKDSSGEWIQVVDESCQTPIDRVLKTKASGWVYVLSKLVTERAAFQFAEENGIDLISVITTTVGGSFLTPTVPTSIRVLMSPVTGDSKFLSILNSVNSRMGSIALVHIEDICRAHVFLMEHANAEGRYICCTRSCTLSELVELIKNGHPCPITPRLDSTEEMKSIPSEISSKKIRDLGFEFDYSIQDIVQQSVRCCLEFGFLSDGS
ncbi:NAD(P)-binding Rossmann-fold superfamily protein [Striga hermonthica]|uniref:Dihydroflavonol 4-reductase n=1 Tax=Striga hermonthica TaxID=68872 RepID=A0A9N7MF77_STRHE|nr:NAD(P)-binding Rossmann-fold superfamily protein [Striga hermonthica]